MGNEEICGGLQRCRILRNKNTFLCLLVSMSHTQNNFDTQKTRRHMLTVPTSTLLPPTFPSSLSTPPVLIFPRTVME